MINNEDFAKRLQIVINYYGETASSFAEKIGVQRSSISHILSGRNKPSLEFVLKTLSSFPEVELYWLLNGTGSFPSEAGSEKEINTPIDSHSKTAPEKLIQAPDENKEIERIIIFYTDGSFNNFQN